MMTTIPALSAASRRAAAERFRSAGVEPRLGELWNDPVFQAVLARDRLSINDVRAAIAAAGLPRA